MSENGTALGEQIRMLRMEQGWTQKRLADILGVMTPTVSVIECGKRPPGKLLYENLECLFGAKLLPRLGPLTEQLAALARVAGLEAELERHKAVGNDPEESFEFLWHEYGAADPETLDTGARELRGRLREIVGIAELERLEGVARHFLQRAEIAERALELFYGEDTDEHYVELARLGVAWDEPGDCLAWCYAWAVYEAENPEADR